MNIAIYVLGIIISIILLIILRGIVLKKRVCNRTINLVHNMWDELDANTDDKKDDVTFKTLSIMYEQQNSPLQYKFTIDVFEIICPILFKKYENESIFIKQALEYGLFNGYISDHFFKQFYSKRLAKTMQKIKGE